MTFTRVKELEAQVEKLKKDLRDFKVENRLMEKYLRDKGLTDDFMHMGEMALREIQADMLRSQFKVVNAKELKDGDAE